jgi:hypothetical protein
MTFGAPVAHASQWPDLAPANHTSPAAHAKGSTATGKWISSLSRTLRADVSTGDTLVNDPDELDRSVRCSNSFRDRVAPRTSLAGLKEGTRHACSVILNM